MIKFNDAISIPPKKIKADQNIKYSINSLVQYYRFGLNYLIINGWALRKNDWFDKKIRIILKGNCITYCIETEILSRKDVSQYLNIRSQNVGFDCKFKLFDLKKDVYQIWIGIQDWKNKISAINTGHTIDLQERVSIEDFKDERNDLYLSVHIFKTGGTTFRNYLNDVFRGNLFCYYPTAGKSDEPPLIPGKYINCVHGHFNSDLFERVFPYGKIISWVRDPVERVCSEYYHILRFPEADNAVHQYVIKNKITIEEFIALPEFQNVQSKFIAPEKIGSLAFIGIMEEFEVGLNILNSILQIKRDFSHKPTNVNPQKKINGNYDINKNLRDKIYDINCIDYKLYRLAKIRFNKLKEEFIFNQAKNI